MKKNSVIVVPFNADLEDGCDYVFQTLKILSIKQTIIGIELHKSTSLVNWIVKGVKLVKFDKELNCWLISPLMVIPFQRFLIIKKINYLFFSALFYFIFKLKYWDNRKFLWFFEPQNISVFLKAFNSYTSIYDCVDYWFGFSDSVTKEQEFILKNVSKVFANSNVMKNRINKQRKDVTQVPLGFSEQLMKKNRTKKVTKLSYKNKKLTFGFVGSINEKIDFKFLLKLVKYYEDHSFVFVGSSKCWLKKDCDKLEKNISDLKSYPNVKFVGEKSKTEIANYISTFDFCLIPYNLSIDFVKNSFPMKLLEYFYFGKPVISTSITELKKYKNVILIGNNTTKLFKKIDSVISSGWSIEKQQKEVEIARKNSWENKIDSILSNLS